VGAAEGRDRKTESRYRSLKEKSPLVAPVESTSARRTLVPPHRLRRLAVKKTRRGHGRHVQSLARNLMTFLNALQQKERMPRRYSLNNPLLDLYMPKCRIRQRAKFRAEPSKLPGRTLVPIRRRISGKGSIRPYQVWAIYRTAILPIHPFLLLCRTQTRPSILRNHLPYKLNVRIDRLQNR
jgi:hypothetical protein